MKKKDSEQSQRKLIFKKEIKKFGNGKCMPLPKYFLEKFEKIDGFFCFTSEKNHYILIPATLLSLENIINYNTEFPFECNVNFQEEYQSEEVTFQYENKIITRLFTGEKIRSKFDLTLYLAQYLVIKKESSARSIIKNIEVNDKYVQNLHQHETFIDFCRHLDFHPLKIISDGIELIIEFLGKSNLSEKEVRYNILTDKVKKMLTEQKLENTGCRVAVSEEEYIDLQVAKDFLKDHDFVPWGYSTIDKDYDCEYAFIYKSGNPHKRFSGVLKVDGIINKNTDLLDKSDFPDDWVSNKMNDYEDYTMFYRVTDVLIFNEDPDIGDMENFRNWKDERLTQRGKLRLGVVIKYIGDDDEIQGFLEQ